MNKTERDAQLAELYAMREEYSKAIKALDAVRALDPNDLTQPRDESIVALLRSMVITAGKIGRLMKVSDDALNAEIRHMEAMHFDDTGKRTEVAR